MSAFRINWAIAFKESLCMDWHNWYKSEHTNCNVANWNLIGRYSTIWDIGSLIRSMVEMLAANEWHDNKDTKTESDPTQWQRSWYLLRVSIETVPTKRYRNGTRSLWGLWLRSLLNGECTEWDRGHPKWCCVGTGDFRFGDWIQRFSIRSFGQQQFDDIKWRDTTGECEWSEIAIFLIFCSGTIGFGENIMERVIVHGLNQWHQIPGIGWSESGLVLIKHKDNLGVLPCVYHRDPFISDDKGFEIGLLDTRLDVWCCIGG